MQVSPTLFKAYDLRGVVPETLTEDVAEALGRASAAKAIADSASEEMITVPLARP